MVDQDQYISSVSFLIFLFDVEGYLEFDPSLKQIWTFLTFDPLTTGWRRCHHVHFSMVDTDQHNGMVSFVVENCWAYTFDLSLKQIWTCLTFDPLTTSRRGHQEHFLITNIDQYTDKGSFGVKGCLNFDLDEEAFWVYLNNGPNWP